MECLFETGRAMDCEVIGKKGRGDWEERKRRLGRKKGDGS